MDPITPSSSSSSSNVDSLLNDILGGNQPSAADPTTSTASTTPPPMPDPHAIPTISSQTDADSLSERIARETKTDEAEETAERMHDILEGESDSEVSPGMTPVVEESKLDAVSTMPTMPLDVPPASPVLPEMPIASMAPVAPAVSAMPPVTPKTDTPPAQTPQVAQVPHSGMPKAGIAAALVVIAVTLAGVGAGVALSGQEQDNRNQAYVAPSPVAKQTVSNSAPVNPNSMVILTNSGENAYNDMKNLHPGAREITVNANGLSGVISLADSEIGSKVLFARIAGVPMASQDKKIVAWVMFANGEYAQIGDVTNVTSNGEQVAFISYENFSDQPFTEMVLSEESQSGTSDTSLDVLPTQKVANVAL